VIAWVLPKGVTLAGIAAGKPNNVATIHLLKAAPKSTRLDAAPVRRRSAVRGDTVVDVKAGDAVLSVVMGWEMENFIAVSEKKEDKKAPEKKKPVAKEPAVKRPVATSSPQGKKAKTPKSTAKKATSTSSTDGKKPAAASSTKGKKPATKAKPATKSRPAATSPKKGKKPAKKTTSKKTTKK
jgi:hypothetical protein